MTEYARSETELLLRCASPPGSANRAERIRVLSSQALDWQYLLRMAEAHALTPLLYWGLKPIRPEAIPTSLAQSFQENTRNSLYLAAELFQLVELFAREGIRVLPLKGPTLAAAAYGNIVLRQFVDLDLLVRKEDALQARSVLLKNGYTSILQLNAKWEAAYLHAYDELGLRGPDGHPLVELHWAVTPRYFSVPLDIGQFWERATSVNLGSREITALGAEDLLLVLCLHAAKHCWSRLSMVSDVAWLMRACDIHWNEVLDRARRLGCLRIVLLGAELAAKLLEIPLPPAVGRSSPADLGVQTLTAQIVQRLLQSPSSEGSAGSLLRNILGAGSLHLRAREHWQDRIRYFVRLATTVGVEDWEFVDLPSSLAFLYPMLRFPRLLRKYWIRNR